MDSNFEVYVEEAKQYVALLRLKNIHRMKVAELALKASIVKHGGRLAVDAPTLAKFADAIGINHHTLYEWVRYKRMIYDKLDANSQELYNETSIATIKNVAVGLPRTASPKAVQRKFKKEVALGPVTVKLNKYAAVLNTIIYNVESYSRIHKIPDKVLLEYMKKCRIIIRYCEKTMEARGGKIPKKVREPDIDMDNFWKDVVSFQ